MKDAEEPTHFYLSPWGSSGGTKPMAQSGPSAETPLPALAQPETFLRHRGIYLLLFRAAFPSKTYPSCPSLLKRTPGTFPYVWEGRTGVGRTAPACQGWRMRHVCLQGSCKHSCPGPHFLPRRLSASHRQPPPRGGVDTAREVKV